MIRVTNGLPTLPPTATPGPSSCKQGRKAERRQSSEIRPSTRGKPGRLPSGQVAGAVADLAPEMDEARSVHRAPRADCSISDKAVTSPVIGTLLLTDTSSSVAPTSRIPVRTRMQGRLVRDPRDPVFAKRRCPCLRLWAGSGRPRQPELDQRGSAATAVIRLGPEMRAYGDDGGLSPLDAAGAHLRACQLCWLATTGPHGLTCCTLYYALPEPWSLLVMSSERPRHVANLRTESGCSVCVPRLLSYFGEPARQLTARCDGVPVVDPLRVEAEAEIFYARYPPARDFVDQVKSTRAEAELVPIRLRLLKGEYLDEERYGVEHVALIDAFPSSADGF